MSVFYVATKISTIAIPKWFRICFCLKNQPKKQTKKQTNTIPNPFESSINNSIANND